ncbi:hypothetical protein [Aquibacillus kalidii]|uniref:hypothetical protein n=1 Tax=Aquibacillus kalidii TaxID=2762597 RepID=UPI0016489E49|nr:hypothetical protein [Aquibacillus kalidii]
MDTEKWLKTILYLIVSAILLGFLVIIFQQAFPSNMMGHSAMGVSNSLFLQLINFFFYSLLVILILVILISVFVFSAQFLFSLFDKK